MDSDFPTTPENDKPDNTIQAPPPRPIRELGLADVRFVVNIEQDDIPVRGNAMVSGDEAADKECEDEILARLDRGEIEAWCVVTVTAWWKTYKGIATLSAVSIGDDGEYTIDNVVAEHGLEAEALDDLNNNLLRIYQDLEPLSKDI